MATMRGRPFQPGNPGGPGRPKKAVEQDYLKATVASVSVADWTKVVRKALEQAKRGDAKSRDWLSKMLVGTDPIPLQQLVEELRSELENVRRFRMFHSNGAAHDRPPQS